MSVDISERHKIRCSVGNDVSNAQPGCERCMVASTWVYLQEKKHLQRTSRIRNIFIFAFESSAPNNYTSMCLDLNLKAVFSNHQRLKAAMHVRTDAV